MGLSRILVGFLPYKNQGIKGVWQVSILSVHFGRSRFVVIR